MTNDSFFALMCASIIGLLFGFVLAFAGYRFFLILLPIWGFFFGFGLGAQTIQAIFGTGFLADVTSWVVGFVVAIVFAVLSYLFWFFAVALIGGSLGYFLGAGLMLAITPELTFIAWIVGIIVGVVFALGTIMLNLQKWIVLAATSLLGAGVILGTFLFLFGGLPSSELVKNPVRAAISGNWLLVILFVVIAVLGFIAQYQTSRRWQIQEYNRWTEVTEVTPAA